MCSLTRYLVPAFVVGFTVATLTANDAFGWIAALVTALAVVVVDRVRGTAPTCALDLSAPEDDARETVRRD